MALLSSMDMVCSLSFRCVIAPLNGRTSQTFAGVAA
jgi:hypothetical protein